MTDVVILDSACLKHLEDPEVRQHISRSLRVGGFTMFPTLLNLVEISKNGNRKTVDRSFAIIDALASEVGLLPLPEEILVESARVGLEGGTRYYPDRYLPAVALGPDGRISEEFRQAAITYTNRFEHGRRSHFESWRPEIRREIRAKRIQIADAEDFLRRFWNGTSDQAEYAEMIWKLLELEQFPGLHYLQGIDSWRLFLVAEGYALYERVVLEKKLPAAPGFVDLWYLVYAAGGRRAILVTDDAGLQRAGRIVLGGYRHHGWVESWDTFRAHHY